jgi:hypothetical protein
MKVISNASSIPKSLWGEAAHYAAYTQNRLPCSSNSTTASAVEYLEEKPDPDKLVLFAKGFLLIMAEDRKAGSNVHEGAWKRRVEGYGRFPGAYRWRMADTGKILVSAHFRWAVPVTKTKLPQGNICPPVQPESKDNYSWLSILELSDNESETEISAEISQNTEDIHKQQMEHSKSPEPRKGTRVCKQSRKAKK